jgi:hypothetical protein
MSQRAHGADYAPKHYSDQIYSKFTAIKYTRVYKKFRISARYLYLNCPAYEQIFFIFGKIRLLAVE